ncbi:MAG TPA: UDP-N-acetylmuramoyl-tripeptide--D-alanyl-D-alanine ligase, partial [Nevskiaceae bacterium]|nr:UDP-N-acetylmuramoyl-tripeptide--D-alanyl-D-alanine ligase [Nevskiaceae bacterium]
MQRLSELADLLGAPLVGADAAFTRVTTDSREVEVGDLFVALRGERFDGHAYVAGAAGKGAVGAVVERKLDAPIAQLLVPDALQALQRAAQAWRLRFGIPVVAVTGSNGKTTTKQLLAALFAARGPVLATKGNLNNHIGLPLTLLGLRPEHCTAVIEMGANHPGEIARLTEITRPDVGVITQAGDAHLEGFGSREGVARAKGELFAGLSPDGVAAINADDEYAPLWRDLAQGQQIDFGITAPAAVRAEDLSTLEDGG